ncbi:MAG: hypothetical protein FWE74_06165 [Oscillospiraceae bacterium]|nr:hypothetical protein [Oscillospiraceae bacterium]
MKSLIKILILTILTAIFVCSCAQNPTTNQTTFENIPLPFGEQGEGIGGDELANYYEPGIVKIQTIPIELIRLVPEADEWIRSNQLNENSEPSLMGHANLYSFLKTFKLDENIVIDEFKRRFDMNVEYGWSNEHSITNEDLNIIFTYDDIKVNEYFASEYSIIHADKIYSPAWIYWHDTEAYEAAGITPEMIEEKLDLYAEFSFTAEAAEAFEAKLSEFMETDVVLDRASQ